MSTMTVILLVGLVVGAIFGGQLLFRWLAKRRANERDTYHHFKCKGCQRRLRYQAHQVGRKGKCSNCGKDIVFPPLSESVT